MQCRAIQAFTAIEGAGAKGLINFLTGSNIQTKNKSVLPVAEGTMNDMYIIRHCAVLK